ncbi:hypothetical protein SAMN05216564_105222 [Halopenitus persicus]|uniref:Uncharacterized protein n=1 Tax=Halopenitus persicus TaxID=1048396 RepID=A0A1H3K1E0_9EURY|nr:hypothetical protein SAMN05216564_105222 [Halopenitus persicus]
MFYFPKYMFNNVLISIANHPNSITVFSEITCIIDERFDVNKLVALMKLDKKKPLCRLFRCGWVEPKMKNFVGRCSNRVVQPEWLAVKTERLFINRKLILRYGRDRL